MSSPSRELLELITVLWERYPHWRFGQLVENLAGWADANLWDVTDEELIVAARRHLERLRTSSPTTI